MSGWRSLADFACLPGVQASLLAMVTGTLRAPAAEANSPRLLRKLGAHPPAFFNR
jgi:hypothetical protein